MTQSDLISRRDAIDKIESIDMQVYEGNAAVGRRTLLTKEEVICAIDDIPSAEPERTAKVVNQYRDYLPYARFMADELRGNCENCGETVWNGEKFCHECGSRLEWE